MFLLWRASYSPEKKKNLSRPCWGDVEDFTSKVSVDLFVYYPETLGLNFRVGGLLFSKGASREFLPLSPPFSGFSIRM